MSYIKIEGYGTLEITDIRSFGWPCIEAGGMEFYVFSNRQEAGEAARQYWEDLAQDDPEEFTCLVGQNTLIQWALGNYAGPGGTHVRSLYDWLDLWLYTPEEHFSSYDGTELEIERVGHLIADLGWNEADILDGKEQPVAYRHN